jgi:hypothetical protein
MAREIRRQALTLAYADSFAWLALLFLLFAFIPPFLTKPGSFADPAPTET